LGCSTETFTIFRVHARWSSFTNL